MMKRASVRLLQFTVVAFALLCLEISCTNSQTNGTGPGGSSLSLKVSNTVFSEENGSVSVSVQTGRPVTADLDILIQSSDPTELRIISSPAIVAGGSFTQFDVRIVDDVVVDGDQQVTLTVSALGYDADSVTVTIRDNDIAAPIADWARGAVIYHVYVRSFMDSNDDGHGDFAGLAAKLDYIQDLGADAILLLPIVNNDHDVYGGYAPTHYFDSEPQYGSLADFDQLVSDAHNRGLKVLIDLPLDLSADTHPYFTEASSSVTAAHHNWYVWTDAPCPNVPGYFGQPAWNYVPAIDRCFWTKWDTTVPEWNFRNPDLREMMFQVAEFWLARRADGFRLDSAPGLEDQAESGNLQLGSAGTHAFWTEFMARVKTANPQAVCVAEVFSGEQASVNAYYADGIDMVFDYPVHLEGLYPALFDGDRDALATAVANKLATVPQGYLGGLFLGNHDVPSGGRAADLMSGDQVLMTLAAGLLFSLPATPFVYYGEEIGLPGAPLAGLPDNKLRNPMQWDDTASNGFTMATPWTPLSDSPQVHVAAQDGVPGTMLETYRGLISIRRQHEALQTGTYTQIGTRHPKVYAFLRQSATETILVLANLDAVSSHLAQADLAAAGISTAAVTEVIWFSPMDPVTPLNAGAYGPLLNPRTFMWLSLG